MNNIIFLKLLTYFSMSTSLPDRRSKHHLPNYNNSSTNIIHKLAKNTKCIILNEAPPTNKTMLRTLYKTSKKMIKKQNAVLCVFCWCILMVWSREASSVFGTANGHQPTSIASWCHMSWEVSSFSPSVISPPHFSFSPNPPPTENMKMLLTLKH